MAATLLSDVSAALSLMFRDPLQTQINSVAVLPFLLPILSGGGKSLDGTAEFSGATDAVATVENASLSNVDADDEDEVPYSLQWAQYTKVSSVTDLSQAATASNFNPASVAAMGNDLLLGKTFRQTRRLTKGLSRDLYAGNPAASPPQLAGADLAIDSSGTFAGINPVTYTEWAAHENTGLLSGMTLDTIRTFFTDIYLNCGWYPEFCTAGATVFNAIRALYSNFESQGVREIEVARGGGANGELPRIVKLMAGHRTVEVDQVPIILDKDATGTTLYAWNTNFVAIRQLEFQAVQSVLARGPAGVQDLFRRLSGNRLMTLPRKSVEGMIGRGEGLRPFIKLLGDRGMTSEAVIGFFAQVEYTRRNAFGKYIFT